jgi:spermidine/putrescine transport system substrate-binding protein
LIAAKPRIRTFAPDTGQDLLIAGEVGLCLEYNGDILQVMAEDDDLANVVPEEGTGRWEDTMCIPVGAPNPEAAHAFIDYIYEPDVHAAIAEYIRYALPNGAAKELIPEERPR